MRISIVTTSYNQAEFLPQALESVLNQGISDLEFIVVDPGSTDGSRDLIDGFEKRIAERIYARDKGAADGLKNAFRQATGEIYGFLNSDDFLYPGALSAVEAYFEQHPEIDILLGNGWIVNGKGEQIRHIRSGCMSPLRYLHGGARWLQQSTFFRASIYNKTPGFNPYNKSCWDGECLLEMMLAGGRVGYLHQDLGAFRVHASSITGSRRIEDIYAADSSRLFERVYGRPQELYDRALSKLYKLSYFLLVPSELFATAKYRILGRLQ
jgi:glycosyltransferase involved in cell wall biosynthesis